MAEKKPPRTPVLEKTFVVHTPSVESALGLGDMFEHNHFEITEEEFDDRVQESLYGDDSEWEGLTNQMTSASCAFFAQEILSGAPEPPYNGKFFVSDHHEEWDDLIDKYDRICVLAARDHGKSWFFNFAYPIWKASRMNGGRGFIFSATEDQAIEILGFIKSEIEQNPKLSMLLPTRRDEGAWSKKHIRLANGHHIYARGFGVRVRGAHPHWIICDDILNDETAYSETVRNRQKNYFYSAITNMILPGGQIIVVGTPFSPPDLYGDLRNNPEYEFQKYPAIRDGKALWPERYSIESLARRKREIGNIRFAREFMCDPTADDMSLFPLYLFKGEPTEQFAVKLGMPLEYWQEVGVDIFMGGDFAMSANVGADYTVVFTIGVDTFGNRWIVNIERVKGMPYQHQLSMINATGRKYDPSLIYLEDNQMQRIFGDELIRLTDLPIKKFTTGVQKHSLEKGVPSLRVLLENGKFRIPRGDAHSIEMTDIWIEEMRAITFQDGKVQSVGENDDTVLALWLCDQAIRQGGFKFSFGPDDDDEPASLEEMIAEMTGEAETDGTDLDNDPLSG